VVTLQVPPLRDRSEDLPALIDHFLSIRRVRHRRPQLVLDPRAGAALLAHSWPGNVRELVNALEHAVVLAQGNTIAAEDLPEARTCATCRRSSRKRSSLPPAAARLQPAALVLPGAGDRHQRHHSMAQATALGAGLTRQGAKSESNPATVVSATGRPAATGVA
jgi:DNA-binding NtrC family response regulator